MGCSTPFSVLLLLVPRPHMLHIPSSQFIRMSDQSDIRTGSRPYTLSPVTVQLSTLHNTCAGCDISGSHLSASTLVWDPL